MIGHNDISSLIRCALHALGVVHLDAKIGSQIYDYAAAWNGGNDLTRAEGYSARCARIIRGRIEESKP